MVHFKITDAVETRRFQVNPGELTFEQLKEKIATLFPKTAEDISNLTLHYRDTDGDIITLSSDGEFQEVLSDLPENHVWKLHITSPLKPCQRGSHIWLPSQTRNPWSEFDRQFKETQELMSLLFGLHDSTSPTKDTRTPPASEKERQGESEESDTPETTESRGDTEGAAKPKLEENEEVRSGNTKKESASEPSPSWCPLGCSGVRKSVGVCEPLLFGGLFGPTHMFSPVQRYRITCNHVTVPA